MLGNEIDRKRLKQLDELLEKLGVTCGRMGLLDEALIHSSWAAENPGVSDNERLEFFGDAVLKFVVSEYLLERFPNYNEGQLTEIRAVLVSSKTLGEVGLTFNLGKYIKVGRRVSMRPSIVSRSMEAILGAIYLDSGLIQVQNLIIRLFGSQATTVDRDASKENYKAQLQELTQSRAQGIPIYEVASVEGPAHDPMFTVTVAVEGNVIATGKGQSKKAAEQIAAREAFAKLAPEAIQVN
jgi:ribonuclease III